MQALQRLPVQGATVDAVGAALESATDGTAAAPSCLHARAIQAAPHGLMIMTASHDSAQIQCVNKTFSTLTGYGADGAVGRSLRFLLGADQDQPEFSEVQQAIAQGRAVSVLCAVTARTEPCSGTRSISNRCATTTVAPPISSAPSAM